MGSKNSKTADASAATANATTATTTTNKKGGKRAKQSNEANKKMQKDSSNGSVDASLSAEMWASYALIGGSDVVKIRTVHPEQLEWEAYMNSQQERAAQASSKKEGTGTHKQAPLPSCPFY